MAVMLLEWGFTSTFLILVVLALRAALGKRMSAGLRYALWAVVLLRLLVPVQLFTSPIAGTWVVTEKRTEHNVYTPITPPTAQAENDSVLSLGGQDGTPAVLTGFPQAPNPPAVPDPPAPPDFDNLPGWAWLAGSAAVAFVFLASNLRFYWRLRRERIPLEGMDCPLRVYAATGLPSPCLFGIFRPAVYIAPEALANPDMLRHVLAHEYTHFRHGDHLWSLLRCAALAAHWWNPLVWVSAVLSQRDAELACDEGALKRLGDGERAAYGGTLLALVTAKPRPGDLFRCATTMAGDKKSLKERVSRIAIAPKRVVWAVVAAVLVTALACVCAFGQAAEPGEEPEPDPAPSPTASQEANDTGPYQFALDAKDVPAEVLADAENFVRGNFESLRDDGIAFGLDGAAVVADPPELDDWRIESLTGPYWSGEKYWELLGVNRQVELWNVVYAYHTTTPEKVKSIAAGSAELTEDGWITPINYGAEYLVYELGEDGSRTFLTTFGELSGFVGSVSFRKYLRMELSRGGIPEDMADVYFVEEHAELPLEDRERPDLNRNGVPELVQVVSSGMGDRLEVWEGNQLLWVDEAHSAHVGWNAVFLCTLDGQDYLLRYNPYMSQGVAEYSCKLFTLENGEENAAREGSVEFDINFHPLFQSHSFDPEAIAAFVDEVNGLLAHSVQLINTDQDLLGTFEREGRLYDSLWWLDALEPAVARDDSKSLLKNLQNFQAAMEAEWYAAEPAIACVNASEEGADIWLSYQNKNTRFTADRWEYGFQPAGQVPIQVVDLNHDGRDEIVFPLVWGHGTGVYIEKLFVFDAETLEQYDTSGLNEMVLNSVQSTGDEDWFYLQGPGMPGPVVLNKHTPRDNPDAPVADAISLGEIVQYTVNDGEVNCWLGCDLSGMLLGYEGYLKVSLEFTAGGSFQCTYCEYVGEIES